MFSVTFSTDLMEATIRLDITDPDRKIVTAPDIVQYLKNTAHVEEALIDVDAIERFIANKVYNTPIVVARGLPPKRGADGWLRWHVDTRPAIERVARAEAAKTPLRDCVYYGSIARNGLIVNVEKPERGESGRNLFGRRIDPHHGMIETLPEGRHVIVSPDKTKMHAARNGRVVYMDGIVDVIDCFHFNGNLTAESGKIDFEGDVLIEGNVLEGAQVCATGIIEVKGTVEGALLQAQGDIIMRGGVCAAGKGMISSQSSVFATAIEYATVEAAEHIVAERISYSNVICGGKVEAIFQDGYIIGGNISAGEAIVARTIGQEDGKQTSLEVGTFPRQRERMNEIERELTRCDEQIHQMMSIAKVLPAGGSVKDKELRTRIARELIALRDKHAALADEKETLSALIKTVCDGYIAVGSTMYAGCRLAIGSARCALERDAHGLEFRQRNNAIVKQPIAGA